MRIIHNNKKHLSIEFCWPRFVWTKDAFNEFSDQIYRVRMLEANSLIEFNEEKDAFGGEDSWQFRLMLLGFGFSIFGERFESKNV